MLSRIMAFSWARLFTSSTEYSYQILGALRSQLILVFVTVFVMAFIIFFMVGLDRVDMIRGVNVFFTAVSLVLGVFTASIPIIFFPVVVIGVCFTVKKLRNYHGSLLQLRLKGISTIEGVESPKALIQSSTFRRMNDKQKEEYQNRIVKKLKCRYRLWIITYCCAFAGSLVFLAILGRELFPEFVEVFGGDAYNVLINDFLHLE